MRTLAHLSDLHIGLSASTATAAMNLVETIIAKGIDHVVITGDITHKGKISEFKLFQRIFKPLLEKDKVTIVPGNHDRLGNDLGHTIMGSSSRILTQVKDGLYLVRIDSTGTHNKAIWAGHGDIGMWMIDEIEAIVAAAPRHHVVILLLHHHLFPLPEESFIERFSNAMAWPYASELKLGRELIKRVGYRVNLILHGHRHTQRAFTLGSDFKNLHIYNAGSSTASGSFRVFAHEDGIMAETEYEAEAIEI